MPKPEDHVFYRPNRQSPVAILLILSRLFRFLFRQFWPVLLVFFFRPKRAMLYSLIWVAVVLSLVSSINSILAYFYSFFYVSEGELILEKGWLRKTRLSVPLDRIQTISFQQSFVHRLFGVVSVEIDTAGSKGSEFSLQAIEQDRAHALRDFLLSHRGEAASASDAEEMETPPEKVLLQLGISDLFKIGISQNHLRTAGILLALGLGFLDDVESVLGEAVYKDLEKSVGSYFDTLWWLTLAFVTILLILSFLGTMILTAVRNYDLRFVQTGQGFKMVAGLFAKREQSASLRKIQFIRWSSHPIQRWLGMFSLRLYQAAGYNLARQKTIQVPGCYWPQLEVVKDVYFPGALNNGWEWHAPTIHFFKRRFLFLGIIPALAGTALGLITRNYHFLPVFFLWAPVAYYWQRQIYRTFQIGLHPGGLQLQQGFFTRETTYLRWEKIQGISLNQSPYQQKHEIASLELHTASGDISLPYLPLEKARLVRDYVLFRVETTL